MSEAPLTEDELRQIEAYQTALSLMSGGNIAPRLHKLLNLLECRELMRRKRRQDNVRKETIQTSPEANQGAGAEPQ